MGKTMKIDKSCVGVAVIAALLSAPASAGPQEDAMAKVRTYKFGESTAPLSNVEDIVRGSLGSPDRRAAVAASLTELLTSDATPDAKQFACRQLALCGGPENVPGIAAQLTSEELSDYARYALERIPGPEADKALLGALSKAQGKAKVGIINSLGVRGVDEAVNAIAKYTSSKDEELADAAICALGDIGGDKAVKALNAAKRRAGKRHADAVANALLTCAEDFAKAGEKQSAERIYRSLSSGESDAVQRAAKAGLDSLASAKKKD